MPQLDKVTFLFQSLYVFVSFILTYYLFVYFMLPNLQVSLKQRELINKIILKELKSMNFCLNLELNFLLSSYIFVKLIVKNSKNFLKSKVLELFIIKFINIYNKNMLKGVYKIYFKLFILNSLR